MPNAVRTYVPTPRILAAALLFAFTACGVPSADRSVTIGSDIALELDFDDPVVITIESQTADARSWLPIGYLAMPRGVDRVTMNRIEGSADLRFTLGVAGTLVDRADGRVVADGSAATTQNAYARALDVRGARIATQLQVARGTIATIRLEGATTATTTRPFPR